MINNNASIYIRPFFNTRCQPRIPPPITHTDTKATPTICKNNPIGIQLFEQHANLTKITIGIAKREDESPFSKRLVESLIGI